MLCIDWLPTDVYHGSAFEIQHQFTGTLGMGLALLKEMQTLLTPFKA